SATAPIPSAALRASQLRIVGSGQGSVGTRDIVAELPALAEVLTAGGLPIATRPVGLAEVASVWTQPSDPRTRIVIVP
ncbi:hypothetical protein, partial [Mesorhizobium japonicum]|uniref:hypothetical protein n=1 Tax=Mesorhizobium japonicum TaxID=2066070 RepID=UPI003B5BDDA7